MTRSTRGLWLVVAALLAVALGSCLAVGGMMGPWMGHGAWGGHGWGWPIGMGMGGLAMVLFWGAVVAALYLLSRHPDRGQADAAPPLPLDIVKRRYAHGEITREEFEQMRQDLER